MNEFRAVSFEVSPGRSVSGRLMHPDGARACLVLAHGAGAGMDHPSVALVASGLSDRGIATFRYQFPFMQAGSKRPDSPPLAHATVRAAVTEAARLLPGVALVAGGRSFGGRMTAQAQALEPLPNVRGLAFLAFPLHPAGRPSTERPTHLADVDLPLLFLQGTNDALAEVSLIRSVVADLGPGATLHTVDGADHAFHVPARSGRKDVEVMAEVLDVLARWVRRVV
ncbi:alpha/beta family hydrolase [Enterovirga sp. CN4-39]|uniref:alpha/beta hydrolase family protein n=1 Tax=Enterovirga sp. CN4-39 TaxID=3400910 RepID=UPI003C1243F5